MSNGGVGKVYVAEAERFEVGWIRPDKLYSRQHRRYYTGLGW
jgi:hypothetical protein